MPETFIRDAAAAARFQREAEALASLNHPNVGAIYDIAESQDSKYLVIELIEGETPAKRIARGPIPIEEALPIARQIAEGLEAAHEKGVVHRDLKPANVKLTPGGIAKVLDFGIAKTRTVDNGASLTDSPAIATSTMPGMIMGTAAYMPPEQAKGKVTDRTADVWSFGCVFYEMLTGRPAFGKEVSRISEMLNGGHWSLSRDGLILAQEKGSPNIDIWRFDFGRMIRNRVTSNPITDTFPILSPNADRIVFASGRKSIIYDLYTVLADKPDSDELLLSSSENKIATDWSRDGRYILYRNFSEANGYDVWALPVDANGKKNGDPIAVVSTPADERDAQFSPDGNWVAYQSNDTGSFEIYVQAFPGGGAKHQVSKGGGTQVRWNPTGKELFYISLDGQVTSVPMKLDPSGQHFEAGTPVALFQSTLRGNEIPTTNRQQYAVSADGQQIFMRGNVPTPGTVPIMLILNWKPKS